MQLIDISCSQRFLSSCLFCFCSCSHSFYLPPYLYAICIRCRRGQKFAFVRQSREISPTRVCSWWNFASHVCSLISPSAQYTKIVCNMHIGLCGNETCPIGLCWLTLFFPFLRFAHLSTWHITDGFAFVEPMDRNWQQANLSTKLSAQRNDHFFSFHIIRHNFSSLAIYFSHRRSLFFF